MNLEEKKQIYLDRFPAIIGKRMADQYSGYINIKREDSLVNLIGNFHDWYNTKEQAKFWYDVMNLYAKNKTIEHQQILDIFHKHDIKP